MTSNHAPNQPKEALAPRTRSRAIGGTTYIVVSEFSPDARETAVEKMRRIILEDSAKVL
ncbi:MULTISPECIES: transposon-encoded TnpW family protein [Eubacteriales]|uniref:transposon-encoded TnpW family protein n=1 Tax=Eubacteriales TaxID=186802 RepID=UPI002602EDB2|nr:MULTISPECIES: transposon-encoded TnpW family protein [Eubacteriales]